MIKFDYSNSSELRKELGVYSAKNKIEGTQLKAAIKKAKEEKDFDLLCDIIETMLELKYGKY